MIDSEENKYKDNKQVGMQNNTQKSEEEIDLGQLFSLIGKAFSIFFNFIASIFKFIFKILMLFVIFFRHNFIKLAAGALFGLLIGGIYQYNFRTPVYKSDLALKPNFGSAIQLYKNVDYYQSLIKQKNYERLSAAFSISKIEAADLISITAEPYTNTSQTVRTYKNFTVGLDSTTINLIEYKDFIEDIPVESYEYHTITVESKDRYIFTKLRNPIINSIIKNNYYKDIKLTFITNLESRKNALELSIVELGKLRSLYKEVLLAESSKPNSGTSIVMSQKGGDDKELLIFDKFISVNSDLIEVNKKLNDQKDIINVISSFNTVGSKVGGVLNNFMVIGFLLGFIIVFILLSTISINSMISDYEKRKSSN